ncbi:MAG: ABC transporter ATP-binding protein [Spirochaetales bacterium]|nr:ABC transporter ATP-binding protein [Spirochaetales bacterium]
MAMIEINSITKHYRTIEALKGVSLCVQEGTIFGFLGPNGAGKTTLIRILAHLIEPTSGSFSIDGKDLKQHIGYLAQQPAFYPWMTARELLRFSGKLYGLTSLETEKRIHELLSLCGIQAAADRRVGTYSGGMIQRLGIAQAILHKPKVVLLDEPASALDPIGRKEILTLISRLHEETTVFMSSHILEDIQRVCDEVAIIADGSIVLQQDMDTLLRSHAQPLISLEFDHPSDALLCQTLLSKLSIEVAREAHNRIVIAETEYQNRYSQIMNTLNDHDLRLRSLNKQNATLEDVFMHHIKERSHA